ncbi:hypothetical protein LCGC14_0727980 [marine sediment metagenome]|uniref:Uncharacterized protein n=1 Tax=marine sediment metagenome TaxID=412755 RepID=A0A0F9SVQ4_9ZZZZ
MTPAKKVFSITALVTIAAVILGGVVVLGNAIMHARGGMGQIQDNTDRSETNEVKIDAIKETVTETHADVRVIRALMEREHP